jgi:hypothetical protein
VKALYLWEAPQAVLRDALRCAWFTRYKYVQNAFRPEQDRDRITLVDAFRAAAFPVPDTLPEQVVVYHGQNDLDPDDRVSYTTSRGAACFWATNMYDTRCRIKPPGNAAVLRRVVPRSSIVFYDPPGEVHPHDEIISDLPVGDEAVDGTLDEWCRTSRLWMRMAQDSTWMGEKGLIHEPDYSDRHPPGSLSDAYADRAQWPALAESLGADIMGGLDPTAAGAFRRGLAGHHGEATTAIEIGALGQKGKMALMLHLSGAPARTLRDGLIRAWRDRGRQLVLDAAAPYGPSCAPDMFRAAQCAFPAEWGDTVTLYHGDYGATLTEAQADPSWSLDYDVACFVATHMRPHAEFTYGKVPGPALVLRREVPRSSIVGWIPGEEEAVLDAPPGGEVFGTPAEWTNKAMQLCLRRTRTDPMAIKASAKAARVLSRRF